MGTSWKFFPKLGIESWTSPRLSTLSNNLSLHPFYLCSYFVCRLLHQPQLSVVQTTLTTVRWTFMPALVPLNLSQTCKLLREKNSHYQPQVSNLLIMFIHQDSTAGRRPPLTLVRSHGSSIGCFRPVSLSHCPKDHQSAWFLACPYVFCQWDSTSIQHLASCLSPGPSLFGWFNELWYIR